MSSRSTSRKPEGRGERIQKVLAGTGIASRREIDRLVQSGRVVIDGRPAVPGDRLTGQERVFIDGKRIRLAARPGRAEAPEILLYHKPAGEVSARRDQAGRKTAFESLPRSRKGRWIEIGHLDFNASGLLLFTTDGELANRLMRSSHCLPQHYAVRVRGSLTAGQVKALPTVKVPGENGPGIDAITAMGSGRSNTWYEIQLRDSGNRDLRRVFEEIGVLISRLIRIRFGPMELGRLPRGGHRLLEGSERDDLLAAIEDQDRGRR